MLAAPGAIGSIRPHSQTMTGDCQSPIVPLGDILVDELGVVGHDAGIEDQQRQAEARGKQYGDRDHQKAVAAAAAAQATTA